VIRFESGAGELPPGVPTLPRLAAALEAPRQPIDQRRPREALLDEKRIAAERGVDLTHTIREPVSREILSSSLRNISAVTGVCHSVSRAIDSFRYVVTFDSITARGTASSNGLVAPI
jgi:hypothetical protein